MKWLATLLPYLAVALGLFWIHDAFWALLSFHFAILLGRSTVPVKILFQSKDIRRVILSILLCGSSGIILYFLWHYFDVVENLPAQVEGHGLTLTGWFWRQLARADQGLLAPVLGHMAADFTILMAVYLRATGTV